ncbi:DUF962 domain-containing protein [Dasania sp. GY-MA-18]|uniref:DUF962 domain-containing protein n=1 Tax=Dasania phycosphaerae TaxID=2950436 RepID=A0A9J6RSD8_9GAMM|nr:MULTISPECIES: DUF962 domain-containing protein [Dasania]MCR8924413.1 DUF962 domain-containing protein [Dasania sp. GY-MA-18]MCZ0867088.1 DUF962 domain-containing protein [Dasania phycosphaerae]MCZ0870540.1 DUF962 domain-containing protein [Dasania phycosphaerae]
MNIREIIKWQWSGYAKYHQSPINLWLHIIFVPLFIGAVLSFIAALLNLDIFGVLISVLLMITAIGIQGVGHCKETNPAEPFTSLRNAIFRIFIEQLYTFPKFVLSGQWLKTLSGKPPTK